MKKIPIFEAKILANKYNYNQVIILAMKESKKSTWLDNWATTFNKDKSKCKFLGKIAKILAYNFRAFYSDEKMTKKYYEKIAKEK